MNIHGSARDVASYEVSVHALKICGREDSPRQDAIAEAGREAIDLIFEVVKHVYLRPIRHMTIGPGCVFACRGPCAIEKTGLGQQNEGTVGVLSHSYCIFGRGNLLKRSADMHRCCPRTFGSFPGNRCVQRLIHFENAGSIAEFFKALLVAVRQSLAANLNQLSWS